VLERSTQDRVERRTEGQFLHVIEQQQRNIGALGRKFFQDPFGLRIGCAGLVLDTEGLGEQALKRRQITVLRVQSAIHRTVANHACVGRH
jgi:hypothetical protein